MHSERKNYDTFRQRFHFLCMIFSKLAKDNYDIWGISFKSMVGYTYWENKQTTHQISLQMVTTNLQGKYHLDNKNENLKELFNAINIIFHVMVH